MTQLDLGRNARRARYNYVLMSCRTPRSSGALPAPSFPTQDIKMLRHKVAWIAAVASIAFAAGAAPNAAGIWTGASDAQPHQYGNVTCFKTGERTAGMNKICYYDCLGSEAAITVSSVELCPLTIKR